MPLGSQLKSEQRPRENGVTDKLPPSSDTNYLSSIVKGVERLQAASPTAELEGLVAASSKERKYLVELVAVQKRLFELMAEPVFEEVVTANRAALLLAKWPENAPRAFWEAMNEGDSTEVAMAIVKDPNYGLEEEEAASNMNEYVDELRFCDRRVPLHLAVRAKRPDVVIALLVAGAKLYRGEYPSLSEACELGDLESFEAMIAAGATIQPLMMCGAASGGNADIIKHLAAKGLSVKSNRAFYDLPIHLAASQGHTAAVEAILDLGEDVDVRVGNQDVGNTALIFASAHGHIETVMLLVARGAKINLRPGDTTTALDVAVKTGNFAMVKTLLELGADLKDVTGDRFTLVNPSYFLHFAKSVEVAKLLVAYWAVIKLSNLSSFFVPKPVLEYYTRHR